MPPETDKAETLREMVAWQAGLMSGVGLADFCDESEVQAANSRAKTCYGDYNRDRLQERLFRRARTIRD